MGVGDTVMTKEQINALKGIQTDNWFKGFDDWNRLIAEEQEKITWDIAFKEGKLEGNIEKCSAMYKEGRREAREESKDLISRLVEAARTGECPDPQCLLCQRKWSTVKEAEAKLKEWEVESVGSRIE